MKTKRTAAAAAAAGRAARETARKKRAARAKMRKEILEESAQFERDTASAPVEGTPDAVKAFAEQGWRVDVNVVEVESVPELMGREALRAEAEGIFDGMKSASLRRLDDGHGWLVLQNHPLLGDSQVSTTVHSLDLVLLSLKGTLRRAKNVLGDPTGEKYRSQMEIDLGLAVHNLVALTVAMRHAHKRAASAKPAAATSKTAPTTSSFAFFDQKMRQWKKVDVEHVASASVATAAAAATEATVKQPQGERRRAKKAKK